MTPRPKDELLTLHEAAARLGVHYMTAYRYIRTGRLAATKLGGEWQVRSGDVDALRRKPAPDPVRRRTRTWARHAERLLDRLRHADEAGAWNVMEAALVGGADPQDLYVHVLAPALADIGRQWEDGRATVADEHRVSAVARRLVGRLGPRFVRPGRRRGTIVLGAAPGDHHELPVAMLADVLRAARFEVIDLGGATPTESFVATAVATPELVAVGVSVAADSQLPAVRATVAALHAARPGVPVLVGGPAVSSAKAANALGADGWAPDAVRAVTVFAALVGRGAASGSAG